MVFHVYWKWTGRGEDPNGYETIDDEGYTRVPSFLLNLFLDVIVLLQQERGVMSPLKGVKEYE